MSSEHIQTVTQAAMFGAAIGGLLGTFSIFMKNHRNRSKDLGPYKWEYLKQDGELCLAMHRLYEDFGSIDPKIYKTIGDNLDHLVSLWALVADETQPKNHLWTFRAFTYQKNVGEQLEALSLQVIRHRKLSIRQSSQILMHISMVDFEELADNIISLTETYYYNIQLEMQNATTTTTAITEKTAEDVKKNVSSNGAAVEKSQIGSMTK